MKRLEVKWVVGVLAVAIASSGCSWSFLKPSKPPLVLLDVNVVMPSRGEVLPHHVVLVDAEKISSVFPLTSKFMPPKGATVIAGEGRFVIPGLADMHVRLPDNPSEAQRVLDLSLAHGVTVLRDVRGGDAQLAQRDKRGGSAEASPEVLIGSAANEKNVSAAQAREWVQKQKARGFDFIQVSQGLAADAYRALMTEALAKHIPVSGDVPSAVGIEAALGAGQSSVEHVSSYLNAAEETSARLDMLAARAREAKVFQVPTLNAFEVELGDRPGSLEMFSYATEAEIKEWAELAKTPHSEVEAQIARAEKVVRALSLAKAPLMLGSATPGPFRVPGFGLIEEMRRLVAAGLTPAEVLRAATSTPSHFLGRPVDVVAGAPANLVVLDENPLLDVENLRQPTAVVVSGRWVAPEQLEQLLQKYIRVQK